MLCRAPIMVAGRPVACGQCMPCRVTRKRVWTHRIMLEAMQHGDNAFATLTYSDDTLPKIESGLPSLQPVDVQNWLKRLRKVWAPNKLRFYAVGEYGDDTERPHYHVALFGFPSCRYGISRYSTRPSCCTQCDTVRDTWGLGNIMLGTLEVNSAQYIAGYVTKKLTAKDDYRLLGRHPEFARMSLRPGIGAGAMHEVASTLMEFNLEETQADVPSALRHGSRLLPLGRYLKRKLRTYVGKDPETPQVVLDQMDEKLRPLREDAFNNSESFTEAIKKAADGKVARMEARIKLKPKRKTL